MMKKIILILMLSANISFAVTSGQITDANDANAGYYISTVFDANEIPLIQYCQSGQEMYLVDGNDPIQKLTRISHNEWTIADLNVVDGPFLTENDTNTTITPSDVNGAITLVASAPIWNSQHVGALWRIGHIRPTVSITGTFTSSTVSSTISCSSKFVFNVEGTWVGNVTLERQFADSCDWRPVYVRHNTGAAVNYDYSDEETEYNVLYRVVMTDYVSGSANYFFRVLDNVSYGIVRITSYIDANDVCAVVLAQEPVSSVSRAITQSTSGSFLQQIASIAMSKLLNNSNLTSTSATTRWAEGAWSPYQGYPSVIALYEERLVAGATRRKPTTLWFSETDNWTSFALGSDDTSAMAWTISSDKVNKIEWLVSQTKLLIGTAGSEWTMSGSSIDEPLTPTNVTVRRQSNYGSQAIQARSLASSVVFVQRHGKKVRNFKYSFDLDSWIANDITLLSEHISDGNITEIALQNDPYPILWTVRHDGQAALLTFEDSQDVVGWSRFVTDGNVLSIATIPGVKEDEVWMLIQRDINNVNKNYVEKLRPFNWGTDNNDMWFVDCGSKYDGNEANGLSGLSYLNGKRVTSMGNCRYMGDGNVVDGNVILSTKPKSHITVGLPFTAKLLPMKLEASVAPGTMFGTTKRISEIVVRLYNTIDCNIGTSWTKSDSYFEHLDSKTVWDVNQLYTGDIKTEFDADYESAGNIYIFSAKPLPLTVLALKARFEQED